MRGAGAGGKWYIGDVKFLDPLSSNPTDVKRRGALVGFGNTEPDIRAKVFGLAQRGAAGDGNFRPADGGGFVRGCDGDYAHAIALGHEVRCLLFETFGGFSPDVDRLFKRMSSHVMNKMSKSQYEDEASWSTRTWTALQSQRLSVVLHTAAATEIVNELGFGGRGAAGADAGSA